MKRLFVYVPAYEAQAKKARVSDAVERMFEQLVLERPDRGVLLAQCGGIRKVRVGDVGRGKSGSFRFFYVDVAAAEKTFVVYVIRKGDSENISASGRNQLRLMAKRLFEELSHGKK